MGKLETVSPKYMTVSVDVLQGGMNFSMWFTTERFWLEEIRNFPHKYDCETDACRWMLHSNSELTHKTITMVCEYADKMCAEALERNNSRKLANR